MTTDQSYPAIDRVLTILRERLHIQTHVAASSDYPNKYQDNNEDLLLRDDYYDNRVMSNRDYDRTVGRVNSTVDSYESSFFDIKINENLSNINEFLYHERCIDDHHDINNVDDADINNVDDADINNVDDADINSKLSKSNINVDHNNSTIVDESNCIQVIPSKLALIAMRLASMQDLNNNYYRDDRRRSSRTQRWKHTRDRRMYILGHLLTLQHCFDGILGYNQYYRELHRRYQCSLIRLWDEETVANRFNRSMKSNCVRRLGKERLAALYDKFRYVMLYYTVIYYALLYNAMVCCADLYVCSSITCSSIIK